MVLPFDQIFIIHLQIANKRKELCQSQIDQFQLTDKKLGQPIWVDANDGQSINHSIDNSSRKKKGKRSISQSESGCFASHRFVWKSFLESKSETCLILEDDFRIGKDLEKLVTEWQKMPEWDYVNFGFTTNFTTEKKLTREKGFANLFSGYGMWLTHAYAINRKAAEIFLQETETQFGGLDWQLVPIQAKIKSFGFNTNHYITQHPSNFLFPSFIKHTQ